MHAQSSSAEERGLVNICSLACLTRAVRRALQRQGLHVVFCSKQFCIIKSLWLKKCNDVLIIKLMQLTAAADIEAVYKVGLWCMQVRRVLSSSSGRWAGWVLTSAVNILRFENDFENNSTQPTKMLGGCIFFKLPFNFALNCDNEEQQPF